MAGQGTATLDFGAYPGSADASVAVTGQTLIPGAALVEAWIFPVATADHTADEHWVDAPLIYAGNVVAGTGFTIYGTAMKDAGLRDKRLNRFAENFNDDGTLVERAPMFYGQYTVAWVWN